MDEQSSIFFESQRQRYFPAHLNIVPAHLILFHHLPGDQTEAVSDALTNEAIITAPVRVRATGLFSLGHGVAYRAECGELNQTHSRLAAIFKPWLRPQDQQAFRPHITIQNKTSAEEAKQTMSNLRNDFAPFEFTGTGLSLWRYRQGPWQHVATFAFRGQN